jgi:hypothetical protein
LNVLQVSTNETFHNSSLNYLQCCNGFCLDIYSNNKSDKANILAMKYGLCQHREFVDAASEVFNESCASCPQLQATFQPLQLSFANAAIISYLSLLSLNFSQGYAFLSANRASALVDTGSLLSAPQSLPRWLA